VNPGPPAHGTNALSPSHRFRILKASFTPSRFSGPHRSDAGKHRIESGYTVLNRRSPGSDPGGFNIFKTAGAHQDAPGCETTPVSPGHHRTSSGMNRISTVKPPGDTVANRHELCPRWSYGDSRLSHGVSRRRVEVQLRYDYGISRWSPIEIQKQYLTHVCYMFLAYAINYLLSHLHCCFFCLKM